MPINYNSKTREFHLWNKNISYIFYIMENGQLGHLYFGKKLDINCSYLHFDPLVSRTHTAYVYEDNFQFSLDLLRQEYPGYGTTDFRYPAYQIELENGSRIMEYQYSDHCIYQGKKKLTNLPATYAENQEATSLDIRLIDKFTNTVMTLSYSVFEEMDIVTRNVKFTNKGKRTIYLKSAQSMSVDFFDNNFQMMQLNGAWSRERNIEISNLHHGIQAISSTRGASGISTNPFLGLLEKGATENNGNVYGFALVYSGNFLAQVEVDQFNTARVMIGINPFQFSWKLNQDEEFQTPEAIMTYSFRGVNQMSQNFHRLFKKHLCRGDWRDQRRPILINNWEATYFDFNEEKLLDIAEKARNIGVELFVLDDGWFGNRNSIESGLGDWYVNTDKLPNGISGLIKKINSLGMQFGLWIEPEMVNKDSKLYKEHPEWIIGDPNRRVSHGRMQYVLDFSREEVVDFIFNQLSLLLSNNNISYIKWDMNRNITEAYSIKLENDRQGELFHRYILGVYKLYEKLVAKFPKVLFESCASGGGRFDPGMLYYAPQTWTSDNTDAVERLKIQYGTSTLYPLICMGNHISDIPNHQTSRSTSIVFRSDVAIFGNLGIELDISKLSEADIKILKEKIRKYKLNRDIFQHGKFYRLSSPFESNSAGWMVIAEDGKKIIVGYYKILASPNPCKKKIKLVGLENQAIYYCEERKKRYSGSELMNMGFMLDIEFTGFGARCNKEVIYEQGVDTGDYTSQIYTLIRES